MKSHWICVLAALLVVACVDDELPEATNNGNNGGNNGNNTTANSGNNTTANNGNNTTANSGNNTTANNGNNTTANNGGVQPVCNPGFDDPKPCGGDEVGDWHVVDHCTSGLSSILAGACEGIRVQSNNLSITGSVGFEGLTGDGVVTALSTGTVQVPASCAAGTCGLLNLGALFSPDINVSCPAAQNGACECTYDLRMILDFNKGYIASQNNGLLDFDGDGGRYHYCVEGDYMSLKPVPDPGADTQPITAITVIVKRD